MSASRLHLRERAIGVGLICLVLAVGVATWPPILALLIILGVAAEYAQIGARQIAAMKQLTNNHHAAVSMGHSPDPFLRGVFCAFCLCIGLAALHSHQAMTCTTLACSLVSLAWLLFRVVETPGHHVRVPTSAERATSSAAQPAAAADTTGQLPPTSQLLDSSGVLASCHVYFEVLVHIFGLWYCGFLFAHAALILYHPTYTRPDDAWTNSAGLWRLGYVILVTAGGENGGMVFGSLLGRTKLTPRISPNKSRAGALGQVVVSGGVSVLLAWTMPLGFDGHLPEAFLLGLLLGAIATLGDLFESFLKRSVGVKDAGTIIPGAGGMLDRMDGLMFAFPAFYYYLEYGHAWVVTGGGK